MKNMFVRILACMLVLVMALSFAACKDDADKDGDATQNPPATDPGSNNDDWFSDDGDDTTGDDTTGDDTVIEGPEDWDPWTMIHYFAIPNSNISTSVIDIAEDGKITSLQLAKGSTMDLEFDYTPGAASSFEIKFGTETVKVAFGADGKIAILKGEDQLAISSAAYTAASKVVINWNGSKLAVKVGGAEAVSADYTVPADFEKSAELFLIAGEGAKFENAKATLGGSAIEFETRNGQAWEIITADGKHKDAFYHGFQGSHNNYKGLALVNNVDFENASKITISAKFAHGLQHKEKKAANGDTGFVVEVWNTNGEDGTNPVVYENQKISFYKVYLGGYGVSVNAGKWGPTRFSNDAHNNKGGWYSLYNKDKGIPSEVSVATDGPKNDKGKYVFQAENVRAIDEYVELKVEWDRENSILSYYYNGTLVKSLKITGDIFVNDGSGVGIASAAGDVYFKDFNLIVE